jgi:hypothetical protein
LATRSVPDCTGSGSPIAFPLSLSARLHLRGAGRSALGSSPVACRAAVFLQVREREREKHARRVRTERFEAVVVVVHALSMPFARRKSIHVRGRFIRTRGYSIRQGQVMSNALAEATEARRLANMLVDQETRRTKDRVRARSNVARSLGTSPGTIENLQRNRLKRIAGWLRDALRARVVRELEAEVTKLQHEIAVLNQTGSDPRGNEMAAVRADLSAVLEVLGRGRN